MLTGDIAASTRALSTTGELHQPTPQEIEYGERNFARFLDAQKTLLSRENG
jgi:hypothetical protein